MTPTSAPPFLSCRNLNSNLVGGGRGIQNIDGEEGEVEGEEVSRLTTTDVHRQHSSECKPPYVTFISTLCFLTFLLLKVYFLQMVCSPQSLLSAILPCFIVPFLGFLFMLPILGNMSRFQVSPHCVSRKAYTRTET